VRPVQAKPEADGTPSSANAPIHAVTVSRNLHNATPALLYAAAHHDERASMNSPAATADANAAAVFPPVPQQQEMPLAIVRGQPVLEMPQDLYIPPDALEVILEAFEGPLDLLLYLIRRQNLDILDIPIAEITRQYVDYIDLMRELRLELAAEYLVMAAILAEIKSRLLLPRPPQGEDEEEDPRAELVRRLQEYERFKKAAEDIDALPRLERDCAVATAFVPERSVIRLPPPVQLRELLLALKDVLKRAELTGRHAIQREALSVRSRMSEVLKALQDGEFHPFERLFRLEEGKPGIIVTFLAILELAKEHLIEIMQAEPLAPIYLKAQALA
jgi:segregation and condensation protein A